MATKLNKQLKREIDVDGKPYMVTLSPEGVKLTEKGKRLGREHSWKDLLGGEGESRQLLTTAMRDIERALDRADRDMDEADQALDDASAAVAAHTPRLESLAVRFEAGHPAIAEALRELIDALVKAGI